MIGGMGAQERKKELSRHQVFVIQARTGLKAKEQRTRAVRQLIYDRDRTDLSIDKELG